MASPRSRLVWAGLFMAMAMADSHSAAAQSPAGSLWTVDTIVSKVLGEKRTILISLPPEYHESLAARDSFPVLITLDAHGDRRFASVVGSALMLSARPAPEIPPM